MESNEMLRCSPEASRRRRGSRPELGRGFDVADARGTNDAGEAVINVTTPLPRIRYQAGAEVQAAQACSSAPGPAVCEDDASVDTHENAPGKRKALQPCKARLPPRNDRTRVDARVRVDARSGADADGCATPRRAGSAAAWIDDVMHLARPRSASAARSCSTSRARRSGSRRPSPPTSSGRWRWSVGDEDRPAARRAQARRPPHSPPRLTEDAGAGRSDTRRRAARFSGERFFCGWHRGRSSRRQARGPAPAGVVDLDAPATRPREPPRSRSRRPREDGPIVKSRSQAECV